MDDHSTGIIYWKRWPLGLTAHTLSAGCCVLWKAALRIDPCGQGSPSRRQHWISIQNTSTAW
eukprot:scaffold155508_cov17-Tisochrysis_lutea.AAC.2